MLKAATAGFSGKLARECAKRGTLGAVCKPLPQAAQEAMKNDLPSPGKAEKALKGHCDLTAGIALFSAEALKRLEEADRQLEIHHQEVSPY